MQADCSCYRSFMKLAKAFVSDSCGCVYIKCTVPVKVVEETGGLLSTLVSPAPKLLVNTSATLAPAVKFIDNRLPKNASQTTF